MSDIAVSIPALIEPSDADLILSALQGNQSSYNALIQRHQPAVFRMAHRYLRQQEESEDVVQQVFLKVYQHLGKFRGESKFSTWVYSIALNTIRKHTRYRNVRRMSSLDAPSKNEDSAMPQWPDKSPSVERTVFHRWELERVILASKNLAGPYRAIFTLHYFQHLPLKEVAIRVGRPAGTVKVYLQRARVMILNQLEK